MNIPEDPDVDKIVQNLYNQAFHEITAGEAQTFAVQYLRGLVGGDANLSSAIRGLIWFYPDITAIELALAKSLMIINDFWGGLRQVHKVMGYQSLE